MKKVVKKIKKMSAAEIIMAMVEGLREPVVKVDMSTYGDVRQNGELTCYGCAATNTIAKIAGYDKSWIQENVIQKIPSVFNGFSSVIEYSLDGKNLKAYKFIDRFEAAIDYLRRGEVDDYNVVAGSLGIAKITNYGDLWLPTLNNAYNEEELKEYEELAAIQDA